MATREENLKKINAELEKLDDEQLEKVAGGLTEGLAIWWESSQRASQQVGLAQNQSGVKQNLAYALSLY